MELEKGYEAAWFDHGICLLHVSLNDHGFHDRRVLETCGIDFKPTIMEFVGNSLNWFVKVEEFDELGSRCLAKMRNDKSFLPWIEENTLSVGRELQETAGQVRKEHLPNLANEQLAAYYKKLFRHYLEICHYGIYVVSAEVHNLFLTNALKELIDGKSKEGGFPELASDYFNVLTFPNAELEAARMKQNALGIALLASDNGPVFDALNSGDLDAVEKAVAGSKLSELVDDHVERFCWVNYGYTGPALSRAGFIAELTSIVEGGNVEAELLSARGKQNEIEAKRTEFLGKLGLNFEEEHLIKVGNHASFLKAYRKELMSLASFTLDLLSTETAKRFGLGLDDVRACTKDEILRMLEEKTVPDLKVLKERQDYCGYITITENDYALKYGHDLKSLLANVSVKKKTEDYSAKEIKGHPASKGFARGVVKIVNSIEDMQKLVKGDILVSVQTNPELVPAMKKAGAIVTDMGGITSHAAIVSRELGVPCVIGTKIATKWLKDGDEVEVDANTGMIRKLEGGSIG